ncbi:MAG: hypothetical protein ACRDLO_14515, partial [Solirubrobacterales bacterium]
GVGSDSRPRGGMAPGRVAEGSEGDEGKPGRGPDAERPAAEGGTDPDMATGVEAIGDPAADDAPPAPDAAEAEPVTPYVAAGFGALALALGAGFLWYRRRLP